MGTVYRPKYRNKKSGEVKQSAVYWIKYYRNGKPYRESTKSVKEADAKRLLKKREGEVALGKVPGIYFDKVTFDELAEDFLTDYRINQKKSLVRAQYSVDHLKKNFDGVRVPNITTARVNTYVMDRMKEGAANTTINRESAALKCMLNLGARKTPPKVDRVPHIKMLEENNTREGYFEHDEFLALRGALPSHLKDLATFGYKVGWRISEITTLKWSQIDLLQGIVRLEIAGTKNKQARTVYLDDELKKIFNQLWNNRKSSDNLLPWVFVNQSGSDRVKRFDKAWKKACKDAGIGIKLFHDFRRTAVRNMVRSGIPERVAMMISGHKTRSVFDRYNIVNDQDLKLAAQKQQAYLESQMGKVSGKVVDFEQKLEVQNG